MKNETKFRIGLFVAVVLAAFYGFWDMFDHAVMTFTSPSEDMTFAWFVPVFSLYLLWRDRAELVAAVRNGRPSWVGAVLSLPFLLMAFLGTRGIQIRFELVGFAGLALTLPWAFFGRAVARICLFPAAYLLFTVPITAFLDFFTVHLRLLASSTALACLNGLGFDAVQQGTAIIGQGAHPFSIDVAEPCSGLRSVMALTALTAAYARLTQPTWTRRAALFACALPLAVIGNVARILTIMIVAALSSQSFAMGFYHDYSGFVIFLVATSLMVAVGETISRLAPKAPPETPPAAPCATESPAPHFAHHVFLVLFAALLFAAFRLQGHAPAATVAELPPAAFPANVDDAVGDDVFYCKNEQCLALSTASDVDRAALKCPKCGGDLDTASIGERRILAADTQFAKRIYVEPGGRSWLCSFVFGGVHKNSIHRPELCLPAQGFLMRAKTNFEAGGRPFHAVQIQRGSAPPALLVYTFFNQTGLRTASHLHRLFVDTWDRSVLNRVDRWVMLTVSVTTPQGMTLDDPADRAALERFLAKLAAVIEPEGKKPQP